MIVCHTFYIFNIFSYSNISFAFILFVTFIVKHMKTSFVHRWYSIIIILSILYSSEKVNDCFCTVGTDTD